MKGLKMLCEESGSTLWNHILYGQNLHQVDFFYQPRWKQINIIMLS